MGEEGWEGVVGLVRGKGGEEKVRAFVESADEAGWAGDARLYMGGEGGKRGGDHGVEGWYLGKGRGQGRRGRQAAPADLPTTSECPTVSSLPIWVRF